jgi:hypothetical protein
MPEGTETDPTDQGTLRPNIPPLREKGDKFLPMQCPDFEPYITLPPGLEPNDPIGLFTLYFTPQIIDQIVQYTNTVPRVPQDPQKLYTRANQWYPTCVKEIYIYLGIRIYMTIFVLDDITQYWKQQPIFPYHIITQYMTRNRFQELHMRYRVAPSTGCKTLWDRVILYSKILLYLSTK